MQTAIRETQEETGILVEVEPSIFGVVPSIKEGDTRTVTFFMGRSLEGMKPPVCDNEVRSAKWVSLEEAVDWVIPGDRAVLLDMMRIRTERNGTEQ